jgi:hypothetical protein
LFKKPKETDLLCAANDAAFLFVLQAIDLGAFFMLVLEAIFPFSEEQEG